ncbi:hypothetical protein [Cellulomonas fimi]|uniref:Uncharacterized protein n=1 Tax=Cellulomonas fimi TaxID=1708 RepID=A0A7Y0QJQ8_CELFI|nr:hypothetical protein [Cellulomonas fimi]NMR21602.1 hypothetical protein [Cellulomonas fimi]
MATSAYWLERFPVSIENVFADGRASIRFYPGDGPPGPPPRDESGRWILTPPGLSIDRGAGFVGSVPVSELTRVREAEHELPLVPHHGSSALPHPPWLDPIDQAEPAGRSARRRARARPIPKSRVGTGGYAVYRGAIYRCVDRHAHQIRLVEPVTRPQPEGFVLGRHGEWTRVVTRDELTRLYYVTASARWRERVVDVVDTKGETAVIEVSTDPLHDQPRFAATDEGRWRARVPVHELTDLVELERDVELRDRRGAH